MKKGQKMSDEQREKIRQSKDNGRTLCVPCHKTTDTYLRKAKKIVN